MLKLSSHNIQYLETLGQAWATSGPPSTLMWPAIYIWSFLHSYIEYEKKLNIKKVSALSQKKTLKLVWMDMYWPANT